jgi:hypothetical protein
VLGPPADEIAVRAVFSVSAGPALVGEWTWAQVRDGSSPDWVHADPPAWLRDPEMSWNDRHGPIEVRANVPPGMENAARALLAGSRSQCSCRRRARGFFEAGSRALVGHPPEHREAANDCPA